VKKNLEKSKLKKSKTKQIKETNKRKIGIFIIVSVVLLITIMFSVVAFNVYTESQQRNWSLVDLSTGTSSAIIQQTPKKNIIVISDRCLEETAFGVIKFHQTYEDGCLTLEILIGSINSLSLTDFILTGHSGNVLTVYNFTNYLSPNIYNKFRLNYDVEFNDFTLYINDVEVLVGKFDINADYINGFSIQTNLAGAVLLYVDVIGLT